MRALTARVGEVQARTAGAEAPPLRNGEVLQSGHSTSITGAMMTLSHINPDGMAVNPAFSQAVKVAGPAALVFIGGQNGVDADGTVVGDDAGAQAEQALRNVAAVVEAAGGTIADLVKWTILVTDPASLGPGFGAFQQFWGQRPNPPAISVQVVAGLADPEFLVEVEAVAAIAP